MARLPNSRGGLISARTKAALAEAKKRQARERAADVLPYIVAARAGCTSLQQLAVGSG
jgi:hypothetical protein